MDKVEEYDWWQDYQVNYLKTFDNQPQFGKARELYEAEIQRHVKGGELQKGYPFRVEINVWNCRCSLHIITKTEELYEDALGLSNADGEELLPLDGEGGL